MMNEELLLALKEQVERLAAPVGFQAGRIALATDGATPPPETLTWSSSFALLALVPIHDIAPNAFDIAVQTARDWMARRLTEDERRAKFIDGYLLFALSEAPTDALRESVQRVKLDAAICRKHVLWPSSDADWSESLWTVTVLGLPPSESGGGGAATIPGLPQAADHALQLYRRHRSYETAAQKLHEEAHAASLKEAHNAP
jgi:hypothetical protein